MSNQSDQSGMGAASSAWTPDLLALVGAEFARAREAWGRVRSAIMTSAAPGSAFDVERADPHAAYAHDLAAASLTAALDHLITWEHVFAAWFAPTYAHFSMLRTAGECSWLAYWLLEPGTDAEVRLVRGIAAQHHDYSERKKLDEAMGTPTYKPPAKSAADRLHDLMVEAKGRGLTKLDKNGKKEVLITPLPSAVELFNNFQPAEQGTNGEYLYRLLSGFAHGKQWALTQGVQALEPLDQHGRTLGQVQTDPVRSILVTQHVVNAYVKAGDAFIACRQAKP